MRRKLAAGNWKMNGAPAALDDLAAYAARPEGPSEVLVCPPATLIAQMVWRAGQAEARLAVGGQDCHPEAGGAHTGDLAASMLKEAGATYVILGHSERRTDHGEADALIRSKVLAAHAAGLTAILCLGETEDERDFGRALEVAANQLADSLPDSARGADTVIAYEPVWAIGTGRVPETAQIAEMHAHLRACLTARFGPGGAGFRLLYGGSVKPANAAQIFAIPDVDGALVGGASLKAADFLPIIAALDAAP